MHLDHEKLTALKRVMKGRYPALEKSFLANIEQANREIGKAIANGDWETMHEYAHKIKSTTGQFGLPYVSQSAEALELSDPDATPDQLQQLHIQLQDALACATPLLLQHHAAAS